MRQEIHKDQVIIRKEVLQRVAVVVVVAGIIRVTNRIIIWAIIIIRVYSLI